MTTSATDVPANEPDYVLAQTHLQKGEWTPGLAALRGLAERFPYDHDLRRLLDETDVRARIDQDEVVDRRRWRFRRLIQWAAYVLVLVLLLAGFDRVRRDYSLAVANQLEAAQVAVAQQARVLQLATQYADAQALLRGGRASEAKVILEDILAVDPNYPGARVLLNQVNLLSSLDAQYTEAFQLVQRQAWAEAAARLRDIAAVDAHYRDVALLLAEAERQLLLADLIVEADGLYDGLRWVEAATAYEGIRAVDPLYDQARVEERLFNCYVQAGRAALLSQADSLEALRTAEAYFRKALALRPQDPAIKLERELARLYLVGQAGFEAGRWSDVITNIGLVLAADAQYANGSARQTLYEAYAARGLAARDAAQYEAALADLEAALALAEREPAKVLRLYEAHLHLAETEASQKNYEAAVLRYRTAVAVGDLAERAESVEPLALALQAAAEAATAGNFGLAYEQYRQAALAADSTQATLTYVVQPGEYLALIATRFGSTVKAILLANDLASTRVIAPGQSLVVPVSP